MEQERFKPEERRDSVDAERNNDGLTYGPLLSSG